MSISVRHSGKFLAVLGSLLLVACTPVNNFSDLKALVIEVNSRPGAPVEPVPEFTPYEGFIYTAASSRSPFEVPLPLVININSDIDIDSDSDSDSGAVPVLSQDVEVEVEPDLERVQELLENQSLSELTMVGRISSTNGVFEALIEDGFGTVHRIGIGDHMGRNYGRIEQISNSQLNMIEIVPSVSGGWVERSQTLTLQ